MLAAHALAFGFPTRRIGTDVTVAVGRGESLAVLGGNGAGKTTLLRTLLGLLRPLAGDVAIDGVSLASLPANARAIRIAYVPQQNTPSYAFTVRDAVLMGRAARLGAFGA